MWVNQMTKFKERGRPYVILYRGLWHCARSDTGDKYFYSQSLPLKGGTSEFQGISVHMLF